MSGGAWNRIPLKDGEAYLVRILAAQQVSDQQLSLIFQKTESVIRACRLGHSYQKVGGPITVRRRGRNAKGKRPPTDEEIQQIRIMAHGGVKPLYSIAKRYNVSLSYVSMIIRGHRRRDAGGPISDPRSKHFSERSKIWRKQEDVV